RNGVQQMTTGEMVKPICCWSVRRIRARRVRSTISGPTISCHSDVTGLEVGPDVLDNTQFRRDAFGVTPYLVVSLPEKRTTASLGIAEVIVGPSSNAQAIVASIELLR